MSRIKIAQLGTTHEHANGKFQTVQMLPELFEFVGVADDFSTTTAARFPGPQDCYRDVPHLTRDELLNYPGLQAVCVETPNNELVASAIPCMERGLHIHLDKPAGEDLALFQTLLDGCRQRQLHLQMGYMFRGNPAMQMATSAIRAGWIGEVFEIQADMSHNYGGDKYQEYLGNFRGGIAYNLICHLIDLVTPILGRPRAVHSLLKSTPGLPEHIKNNCLIILEYQYATATLRACSRETAGGNGRRLKISGTKGYFELCPLEHFDGLPLQMTMKLVEGNDRYAAGLHTLDFGAQKDRYLNQLTEFARLIKNEKPSESLFQHDLLVHEIILAAAGYTAWKR
ncbi:MAG: Gfo/Idh/MocA family oxidoreductase [Lentisphaerae bacterium]|jgi:predicted dehydrogenase|nr:Gfo/Idh/MocA family oxidoreductase [Lentisphaerota bacterium]